jgi:hypothetical protein
MIPDHNRVFLAGAERCDGQHNFEQYRRGAGPRRKTSSVQLGVAAKALIRQSD